MIDELIYWLENKGFHFPLEIKEKYQKYFCTECGLGIWNCSCDWRY